MSSAANSQMMKLSVLPELFCPLKFVISPEDICFSEMMCPLRRLTTNVQPASFLLSLNSRNFRQESDETSQKSGFFVADSVGGRASDF